MHVNVRAITTKICQNHASKMSMITFWTKAIWRIHHFRVVTISRFYKRPSQLWKKNLCCWLNIDTLNNLIYSLAGVWVSVQDFNSVPIALAIHVLVWDRYNNVTVVTVGFEFVRVKNTDPVILCVLVKNCFFNR